MSGQKKNRQQYLMLKSYRNSLKVQDSFLNLKRILLREFTFSHMIIYHEFSWDSCFENQKDFLWSFSRELYCENSLEIRVLRNLWELSWETFFENSLEILKCESFEFLKGLVHWEFSWRSHAILNWELNLGHGEIFNIHFNQI